MTGKQRLKVLANYLVSGAVYEKEFTMEKWPQCAIGEASRIPSLVKEGLELEYDSDNKLVPQYDGDTSYSACANFFSMPYDTAWKFFGPTKRRAAVVGRQLLSYLRKRG